MKTQKSYYYYLGSKRPKYLKIKVEKCALPQKSYYQLWGCWKA